MDGQIYSRILYIIEDICDEKIREDATFFGDLGMDSIDVIELIMRIEEEFDIEIKHYEDLMEHMETVGDFARYFESRIMQLRDER